MPVRGDRHLNFTLDEAAEWLGEVRRQAPRVDDNVDAIAIAGVFGVIVLGAILTFIYAAFSGSTPTHRASTASEVSLQPRHALTQRTLAADAFQHEDTAENPPAPMVTLQYIPSSPTATSEHIAPPVAYMPAGWFYARTERALPLRTKEGKSFGAVPDGAAFFATTAASAAQIIVASDGSYWGYGELTPPQNAAASSIPIIPEFEKAAGIIKRLEAFGITNALYIYNREAHEEAYLPAGWSMGDLAQDQPLTNGVNGARIGTIKQGTRVLYQMANVNDWRVVVSADGGSFGYVCIRSLNRVPERTPMRPECRGGVALIHRLQHRSGSEHADETRQALAENFPTPAPDGGEESWR